MGSAGNMRGMLNCLKRIAACIVIVLLVLMFAGDDAYREKMKIPIGYNSKAGEQLVNYSLEYDSFRMSDFTPVVHVYDNETDMMEALESEEISMALLDDDKLSFDNKMTDNRIILCLKIDNKYQMVICVRKQMLEDHLKTAVQLVQALLDENAGNIEVMPMCQWIDECISKGYSPEAMMHCTIPDFVDEMLE